MSKKKRRKAVDPNDPIEIRNGKPRFVWLERDKCGSRKAPEVQHSAANGAYAWAFCHPCESSLVAFTGTEAFIQAVKGFHAGYAAAEGSEPLEFVLHRGESVWPGTMH